MTFEVRKEDGTVVETFESKSWIEAHKYCELNKLQLLGDLSEESFQVYNQDGNWTKVCLNKDIDRPHLLSDKDHVEQEAMVKY